MLQSSFRHNAQIVRHDNNVLVGVLFHYDKVSKNNTMVKSNATVRATSDAILRNHNYPLAAAFSGVLAGRILRYYNNEDGSAFMADFVVFNEAEKQKLLTGELAFSVAWIADSYSTVADTHLFDEVIIYETSIVENPAFNTCAAMTQEGLTCLNSACVCGGNKNSSCGCGGKNSDESNIQKDYIYTMEQQIMEAIAALKEELAALAERVSALEAKLEAASAPGDVSDASIEELQAQVTNQAKHFEKLNTQFEELLRTVSDFVEKTSKSLRYV